MGEAWLNPLKPVLEIVADFHFYGQAASHELALILAGSVQTIWNEPCYSVFIDAQAYRVEFKMTGIYRPDLEELEVLSNVDPRRNYFRIEFQSDAGLCMMDETPGNTGFLLFDQVQPPSTTMAHEFGHSIGLHHPRDLDQRGKGQPGIMCPRGTLVDAIYQYDPAALAMTPGGTLHPAKRKVTLADLDALNLSDLLFDPTGRAVVGGFSSVWHEAWG